MGYFRNEVTIYADSNMPVLTDPENRVTLTTPYETRVVSYGSPRGSWLKQAFHLGIILIVGFYTILRHKIKGFYTK